MAPQNLQQYRDTIFLNTSTGAIEGYLAFDGNKLVHCDQNFQNCSLIISFLTSAEEWVSNNFTNNAILRADDKLYHYDLKTGTLSSALHTFSGNIPDPIFSGVNETETYFSDGDTIFKLLMNGSTLAMPFITESGASISSIVLTKNKVVYEATSGSLSTLKAVSQSGGTPTTLVQAATDIYSLFGFPSGDFIFYNRSVSGGGSIRGVIKGDGTGGSEIQNAFWAGISTSTISSNRLEADRMISLEGCLPSSCAGATVHSVDATNSGELNLGTIPADIFSVDFFYFGGGNNILGTGLSGSITGFTSDVFFIDANQANSLIRITPNTSFSESPISS